MKDIKYYVFYNNNLKTITVLDVGKFTRLYNNEILSPSSNDKNLVFANMLLKSCSIAFDYYTVANATKNAEHDEIELINCDEKPDLMFKTTLKSKNNADLKTYIFCTLKTVSKENNEIVFPFFRHAQNINVIDNEVEK